MLKKKTKREKLIKIRRKDFTKIIERLEDYLDVLDMEADSGINDSDLQEEYRSRYENNQKFLDNLYKVYNFYKC